MLNKIISYQLFCQIFISWKNWKSKDNLYWVFATSVFIPPTRTKNRFEQNSVKFFYLGRESTKFSKVWSSNSWIMMGHVHSFPKVRHTVCELSGVSPAFRCITPVYMWHIGIHVLMVQISSWTAIKHLKIIILHSNMHTQPYFW